MPNFFIFAIMIFPLTFTGCGEGNNETEDSKTIPIRKMRVRSLGQISAGTQHTCALSARGGVQCWGDGLSGKLGNNANIALKLPGNPVVDRDGNPLTGIVQVSAGSDHSCALDSEGKVWCWGIGTNGRLGNDASIEQSHAETVVDGDGRTTPLTGIVQIGGSSTSSCALTIEGGVLCWGNGSNGQLGNKSNTNKDHPVDVVASSTDSTALRGIVQISRSSTSNHTCGVTSEGEVVCWGQGTRGQLGNGNTASKSHPVVVVTSDTDTTPLNGIVQVTTGEEHTCARTNQGGVKCWGKGNNRRLGNGLNADKSYPVDVVDENFTPLTRVVQVASGEYHTCTLLAGGDVMCWGYNPFGQVGNGGTDNTNTAVRVLEKESSPFALSGIQQISVGDNHVCALASGGEVLCWGRGGSGRLGNNSSDNQLAPVKVVADTNDPPAIFTVGFWRREYRCYEDDGTCEFNLDSFLRPILTGAREDASATPEVKVLGVEEDEEVSLHLDANCSGPVLGSGTVRTGETDVTITPTTNLVAKENRIYAKVGSFCSASGADYTYTGGTDRIAGDGEDGSTDRTPTLTVYLLSNGDEVSIHKSADCSDTTLASSTASRASLNVTLPALKSGIHTLYLKQNDICYPRGFDYKLTNYIGETSRVVGGNDFTCAVTNVGGVVCWGEGANGRLGNNGTADTDAPDNVDTDSSDTLLSGIVQVETGNEHACALTAGGNVVCWGKGQYGRLGNDCNVSCTDQNLPVNVKSANGSASKLSGILQIAAGESHTCALTSGGNVKCWGYNSLGRLGDNTTTSRDAPVDVVTSSSDTDPLTGIVQISAFGASTCALTSGGNVRCWGHESNGELGNDCNTSCPGKRYPVNVVASDGSASLLSGIVQISGGEYHICALTSGGNVKCWGRGQYGRLGNGATSNKDAPVNVTVTGTTALTGIVGISTGQDHSCALKSAGGVVCWGEGDNGRLGNNGTSDQSRPVDVLTSTSGNPALANIAQIGLGESHSCAVTNAGLVLCWGKGSVGQLGNDATIDSNLPENVVDESGGSGTLNLGTKNRYACTDFRCGFID